MDENQIHVGHRQIWKVWSNVNVQLDSLRGHAQ